MAGDIRNVLYGGIDWDEEGLNPDDVNTTFDATFDKIEADDIIYSNVKNIAHSGEIKWYEFEGTLEGSNSLNEFYGNYLSNTGSDSLDADRNIYIRAGTYNISYISIDTTNIAFGNIILTFDEGETTEQIITFTYPSTTNTDYRIVTNSVTLTEGIHTLNVTKEAVKELHFTGFKFRKTA